MTKQSATVLESSDMPSSACEITLEEGVREALSLYAPHVKHITVGTMMEDGKDKLLWLGPNNIVEEATLISVADQVLVKYGRHVTAGQINAMRLVKERTSVPVPEVFGFHEDSRGYKYVVMKFIKGVKLYTAWESLKEGQRESVINQLRTMFDELHSVKGTYIGGVGRLAPEATIFIDVENSGPYESETEMNEAILRRKDWRWREYGGYPPESFINYTLPGLPANHDIVLSHGQVLREHVLIDEEALSVTGIVGWSQAGFFPEYWDSVFAMCVTRWDDDWIRYIPSFLKPYYDEYPLWYQIHK